MKTKIRILMALIGVCLLVAMVCAPAASAAATANISFTVDKSEVNVGDTITVVISNNDLTAEGFGLYLEFDNSLVECTGLTGCYDDSWMGVIIINSRGREADADADYSDTVELTNSDGIYSFAYMPLNDTEILAGTVATLTFTAKAEGVVTFALSEQTSGTDEYSGIADTKTVTIGSTAPSCEHTSTKLVPNGDGTHNEVCADDTCGFVVAEKVTCTVDESKTTYDVAENATCCEAGDQWKYLYCACGAKLDSVLIEGTIPATGEHTLEKREQAATCTTPGHKAYWMCDKLGFSFTDADGKNKIEDIHAWLSEDGDGYLPVDPTNHAGTEVTYTINGDTHSATYDCCHAAYVTNEPHTYKENNTCICGAVETFTLTVMDMPAAYSGTGAPEKTFTVPYGTNILDYINKQIDLGNVDMSNQTVNDTIQIGVFAFDGTWTNISAGWSVVKEDSIVSGDTKIVVSVEYTGWRRASEDSTWGYENRGHKVVGWYEIDGNWYYFFKTEESSYSFRAEGFSRVPYNTALDHAPNADDLAYYNANKDTSKYSDAESAVYYFGRDGKLQRVTDIVTDGEITRYAVDGVVAWHVGLVEADGEYYYFAGDVNGGGNVMATGKIYVSRNTTDLDVVIGGIYFFDENGKMILNDGIVDIEGTLYYYEDGRLAIDAGLVKVGDAYYYVRSGGESAKEGQVVVGRKYYVKNTNGLLAAGMYTFDENGKMVIDPTVNANGIVEIDGVYYYYKAGVKQVGAGVVEMTDEFGETFYIYVRSNGQLATGEYWPTTTNGLLERGCYDWGTDGRYYPAN